MIRLPDGASVALVHDYMTQLGGAERVAGILATALPSARLLTSAHLPDAVPLDRIGGRPWQTSYLQTFAPRIPLKAMLPLLPHAMRRLDTRGRSLVLTSSGAFAHHVRPDPGALHVCYCHAPAHFLWDQPAYFRTRPRLRQSLGPLLAQLRRQDFDAARRVGAYVANSAHTARRMQEVYGRDATVVYPPVEVSRFQPSRERSGRFLVVSRLVATKRVEIAIEAANQYGLPLDVIGAGPEQARLQRLAGPTVRMLGHRDDATVRQAMAACTGVLVPGEEDFGLVMAEAQASGRPPIALAAGGALEIIEDGATGFLFPEQTPSSLADAMHRAASGQLATSDLVASAARFDVPVFLEALSQTIEAVWQARGRPGPAAHTPDRDKSEVPV